MSTVIVTFLLFSIAFVLLLVGLVFFKKPGQGGKPSCKPKTGCGACEKPKIDESEKCCEK